jgi:DNA-binding SARP family transcriptional activator
MGSTMDFRLLGPVEVLVDNKSVSISAPRQKTVLALLLAECGKVVSVERLVDALWPEGPPPTARSQIQITISALRRLIGGDVILTRAPGYLIEVPAETIDLNRFESLAADAAIAAEDGQLDYAVRLLRSALAIWSGQALEGARGDVTSAIAARINERRIYILQKRIRWELQLGRHSELVGELREYVAGDPLNEGFRGWLALALYRAGRQSDALHVLRDGRKLLADEMGLDPGGELRRLEHAILTADPRLDLTEAPQSRATAAAGPASARMRRGLRRKRRPPRELAFQ